MAANKVDNGRDMVVIGDVYMETLGPYLVAFRNVYMAANKVDNGRDMVVIGDVCVAVT